MIHLSLKIAAIVVGALIVALLIARQSGAGIGVRVSGNNFTEQIANISVVSWILISLLMIELALLVLLSFR
jgi:preprotein translocase subunit SecG